MGNKLLEFDTCEEGLAEGRMKWVDVLKERHATEENVADFEWWKKDVADQNEVFIHNVDRRIRGFGAPCPRVPKVKRRARLPMAISTAA